MKQQLSLVEENSHKLDNTTDTLSKRSALIKALTGGKKPSSQEERERLEAKSCQRRLQWDKKLSKTCLTEAEVAEMLHTTPETLQERVKNQSLLAISYGDALIFPEWQFDSNNQDGLVEGFLEVLETLKTSVRAQTSWLTQPNDVFQYKAPIEVLRQGEKQRVLAEAKWVGIL